ncbi:RagB/SusD family nutrient uptake outer membrane protein [Chitinophaga horti]|uniref:RagB/SusD family nutrient uptake outer membrane protein n=1 Tax=Chitinophaga horti TaxID=2920382 RepID=A0ABY6IUH3_9BACT|nr:RagB/SusD family nutrient uptake outer membrane protein [Chitinophaga horti]UYQ91017.1 RagB/SusD family nutrient uptake outer membrane protein [Chitinophaga horti]
MPVAPVCLQKDFLNQVPDDRLNIDDVFKRQVTTEQYLSNVYSQIISEVDWNTGVPWEGLSDELDVTYNNYATYAMNLGNWDRNRGDYNFWTHYYKAIRSATYFLERVDENKELTPETLQNFKGEARFLRAYFYFMLMRQYGPVVLMPEKTIAPDATIEEMSIPRSSFDECVNYVVSEMDKSMEDLPEWQSNTRDYSRIKKAMVMAYKARVLLYAASPLYNGNTDYPDFKNKDGKVLINATYDPQKWKRAADAAKAVIDLPYFELYKEITNGKIDPMKSYKNLFLMDWNKEIIMAKVTDMFSFDKNGSPYKVGGWSSWGPTQQIIDDYFMANGRSITDPLSGYVENGYSTTADAYTTANTYNMYVGREPRFYVSITYNGSKWINNVAGTNNQPITVEMFNGGNSGKYSGANWSRTGYGMRKFVHPSSDLVQNRLAGRMEVHMRLGEIYLDYVEALNEYDYGNADVLKYLNLIRERAGITLYGDPSLPAPASQEAMREAIRRERRIELAFENHRYFDTRRWKIAEQTDGGAFYGMNIEARNNAEFFKRTLFETRIFHKKYYLWNIVQGELNRNKNLVENPGW